MLGQIYYVLFNTIIVLALVIGWIFTIKGAIDAVGEMFLIGFQLVIIGIVLSLYPKEFPRNSK